MSRYWETQATPATMSFAWLVGAVRLNQYQVHALFVKILKTAAIVWLIEQPLLMPGQ